MPEFTLGSTVGPTKGDRQQCCCVHTRQAHTTKGRGELWVWVPDRPRKRNRQTKDCSTHQATVDNLPGRLLHLPQLRHKIPEAGLGHHMVGGKDPHAVKGRSRVLGRGQQTPNHFVFAKLQTERQTVSQLVRETDRRLVTAAVTAVALWQFGFTS